MVIIAGILTIIFAILAVTNWGRVIGAGPTILIIGSMFLFGFVGVAYVQHLYDLRQYEHCTDTFYHLEEQYVFNDRVVDVIEREVKDRPDIAQELRAVTTLPDDISSCGTKPEFF